MFDVSIAELMVVVLISVFVMDKQQALELVKGGIRILRHLSGVRDEIIKKIVDATEIDSTGGKSDLKERYIRGDDGNLYEAYDIENIRKKVCDDKNENSLSVHHDRG